MNAQLESRLREHFAEHTRDLPTEGPGLTVPESLRLVTISQSPRRARRVDQTAVTALAADKRENQGRAWWLSVAASVLVVGLIAALVLLDRRDPTEKPGVSVEVDATQATPLAGVDELGPLDWVVATRLPAGVEWLYAATETGETALPLSDGSERSVLYGARRVDDVGDRTRVSIGSRQLSSDGDSVDIDGDSVDIDGVTWTIAVIEANRWIASRPVGSTLVSVTGTGIFGDVERDLIASLVVVPGTGLPTAVLGPADQAIDVARAELGATTYTIAAQESNGFWCLTLRSDTVDTGGCGIPIDEAAPITIDVGQTSSSNGGDDVRAVRGGTVTAQAARVDVEFVDGTIFSVTPTDLSGEFDRSFWITAANIGMDSQTGDPVNPEPVAEVRAYDIEGGLLASFKPPTPT